MKGKTIACLTGLCAVALVFTARLGNAWGYFTTYAQAQGGYTIHLGDQTEIYESFSAWTKHVAITAQEGSQPVYVRVRAFCGSAYSLTYEDASGLWTPGADGYYYYTDVLTQGQTTGELLVRIGDVPTELAESASLNVVVVYESTPVLYDAQGQPYADWTVTLDAGTWEEGSQP
jgi:hypothetical protein